MSNITLPRAVVEQVRDALESLCRHDRHDALAALDAALAEPEKGNCADGSCNCCWTDKPDAKRKPATMKQISAAHGTTIGAPWFEEFARAWKAAERFHGIRKEDK